MAVQEWTPRLYVNAWTNVAMGWTTMETVASMKVVHVGQERLNRVFQESTRIVISGRAATVCKCVKRQEASSGAIGETLPVRAQCCRALSSAMGWITTVTALETKIARVPWVKCAHAEASSGSLHVWLERNRVVRRGGGGSAKVRWSRAPISATESITIAMEESMWAVDVFRRVRSAGMGLITTVMDRSMSPRAIRPF